MSETDVIVVGGGPTGLAMAIELARLGLRYRVVDKSTQPAQWSQALGVQARTLEQFERYGIADAAVAKGRKILGFSLFSDQRQVLHLDFREIHSRYPFVLLLPQSETERLMTDYLASLGGAIERDIELTDFSQSGDHVCATLRRGDQTMEEVEAAWLVGCDGAHSTVRRALDVPFEGDTVSFSFFLGDLHLISGDAPSDELRVYVHEGDLIFTGPITQDTYRFIVALHDRQSESDESPLTIDDFQQAIDRIIGGNLRVGDPVWMTHFRINQRKAKEYRVGRTFLAGDASHIHSPVAGQGMNTGIQDAANLVWKMAAVFAGASDTLLDSYNEERGAVGDNVIATTSRTLATISSPSLAIEKLRDTFFSLFGGISFVQERARGFVSETAINYRHSPVVVDCGGSGQIHAGDRAPDAQVVDGNGQSRRLYEAFRVPGHFLLAVDCSAAEIGSLARTWPVEKTLTLAPAEGDPYSERYSNKDKPALYAIRPDAYVGFRGGMDDLEALSKYAARVRAG